MENATLPKATVDRLPLYLQFVRTVQTPMISATTIARNLGLGEVQVRKDLSMISREGQPKVGYPAPKLQRDLEIALGIHERISAVIVGAGKMGTALMDYDGFEPYGIEIAAAFDNHASQIPFKHGEMSIYAMSKLHAFCLEHEVKLGILTVPATAAQDAADQMVASGITAILNFAPCHIRVPSQVTVQQMNVALALVHLNMMVSHTKEQEELQYGKQIV